MENQLEIYRDGELDPDYKKKRRIIKLRNNATAAVQALQSTFSRTAGKVLADVARDIQLTMYDAQNGTHLRHEYYRKLKNQSVSATRQQFGL